MERAGLMEEEEESSPSSSSSVSFGRKDSTKARRHTNVMDDVYFLSVLFCHGLHSCGGGDDGLWKEAFSSVSGPARRSRKIERNRSNALSCMRLARRAEYKGEAMRGMMGMGLKQSAAEGIIQLRLNHLPPVEGSGSQRREATGALNAAAQVALESFEGRYGDDGALNLFKALLAACIWGNFSFEDDEMGSDKEVQEEKGEELPQATLSGKTSKAPKKAGILNGTPIALYDARSRCALRRLALEVFHLSAEDFEGLESARMAAVVFALNGGDDKSKIEYNDASSAASKASKANKHWRYLKIGTAAVMGGALVGITGGLAAPALGAGLASLNTALGATFAMGSLAGASTLLTTGVGGTAAMTLFGAIGANTVGQKVSYLTEDVEDFHIVNLDSMDEHRGGDEAEEENVEEEEDKRVWAASVLCVSGWIDMHDPRKKKGEKAKELPPTDPNVKGKEPPEAETPLEATETQETESCAAAHGKDSETGESSAPQSCSSDPMEEGSTGTVAGNIDDALENGWTKMNPFAKHASSTGATSVATSGDEAVDDRENEWKPRMSYTEPWKAVRCHGWDRFALEFEFDELSALSASMSSYIRDTAVKQALTTGAMQTALSGVVTAVAFPVLLLSAAKAIDNSWSVLFNRVEKVATVLATLIRQRMLLLRRPMSLMGYGMGALIIFRCLEKLSAANVQGAIEHVLLAGAPVTGQSRGWVEATKVAHGRVVNVFSKNDWMLSILHRDSVLKCGVAGLEAVEFGRVENVDVSDLIKCQSDYSIKMEEILMLTGFDGFKSKS